MQNEDKGWEQMNVRDYYTEPNLEGGLEWEWHMAIESGWIRRTMRLRRERERAMIERRKMWDEDVRADRLRG